ncbi:AAA family ATPase [Chelativorans xinjiangense]|uniref:AAA family ATPase n=1 Tax=Chelativorans xinjiangense TaxID=2681485 RepID=UPI00135BF0EE|nr:AAA family ATPase [Chelativorans xinjiangense]
MGNGGCGKTWLARRLGNALVFPVVHLDDMHWELGRCGVARDRGLRDADVQAAAQADTWIMEGIYGQLVNVVSGRISALVWIDLPEEECIANIKQRGTQRGESQEQFQDLLNWVAEYRTRAKNWNSFEGHSKLFAGFPGRKWHLSSRNEIAAFVEHVIRSSAAATDVSGGGAAECRSPK